MFMKIFGLARLGVAEYDGEDEDGCEDCEAGVVELAGREPKRDRRVVVEGWLESGGVGP